MKRTIAMFLGAWAAGCGGSEEAAKPQSAAKNEPTVDVAPPPSNPAAATSPSVAVEAPKAATAAPAAKKTDDPPGLVLPDSEPDTVGSKGLELPIR